jgi:hypothetical protein
MWITDLIKEIQIVTNYQESDCGNAKCQRAHHARPGRRFGEPRGAPDRAHRDGSDRHHGGNEKQIGPKRPEALDRRKRREIEWLFSVSTRRAHEANVSAESQQAEGKPRLSQADEHCRRPEGSKAPTRKGAVPAHGVAFWDNGKERGRHASPQAPQARRQGERGPVDDMCREGTGRRWAVDPRLGTRRGRCGHS